MNEGRYHVPRTGGFNLSKQLSKKRTLIDHRIEKVPSACRCKIRKKYLQGRKLSPMPVITYELEDDPENNTWSTWYARRDAQNAHFLTEPRTTRASYEFIILKPPTSVYTPNNSQLALLMHCNFRDTLSWILARIALAWMVLQLHWLPYPIPQRPRSLCSTLFSSCIQRRGSRNVLRFFLDVLSPE